MLQGVHGGWEPARRGAQREHFSPELRSKFPPDLLSDLSGFFAAHADANDEKIRQIAAERGLEPREIYRVFVEILDEQIAKAEGTAMDKGFLAATLKTWRDRYASKLDG